MKRTLIAAVFLVGTAVRIGWAEPTIHVEWDEPEALIPDFHYVIDTTEEGTPEFPNVILQAGSLTWRVWSEDSGNQDGIGDIGVISSPANFNFGVSITGSGPASAGARNVRGIHLVPTGTTNYSNITGGKIIGDIEGDLTLKNAFGIGGEVVLLEVEGNLNGHGLSFRFAPMNRGETTGEKQQARRGFGDGSVSQIIPLRCVIELMASHTPNEHGVAIEERTLRYT